MKAGFIFISTLFFSVVVNAQAQSACQTPDYAGFDFWLGEWMVTDTLGNKQGENVIRRVEQGCLVTEEWTGATGGTGRSMNYFNPEDSTWNQLWVSGNGFILKMKGQAGENKMTLTSDATQGQQGNTIFHRITWTLNQDATVTQLWEILNEEKKVTAEAFKGIYIKKDGN